MQPSEDEDEDDNASSSSHHQLASQFATDQKGDDTLTRMDKETNTECVFIQTSASPNRVSSTDGDQVASGLVKRSQTFSPCAQVNKSNYSCKVVFFDNIFSCMSFQLYIVQF